MKNLIGSNLVGTPSSPISSFLPIPKNITAVNASINFMQITVNYRLTFPKRNIKYSKQKV